METCILIPKSLSIVLTPSSHSSPLPSGKQPPLHPPNVTLWANEPLVPGEQIHTEDGEVRLDHLDTVGQLQADDVSSA